ncbi:MAG: hypothetical protein H7175_13930 [Burkholderiales bacterium]|nr:hypothetical protein [Anaerolineae bacterium]
MPLSGGALVGLVRATSVPVLAVPTGCQSGPNVSGSMVAMSASIGSYASTI